MYQEPDIANYDWYKEMTAYERGGEAYGKGVSLCDNPYTYEITSFDWYEWNRGWHELGKGVAK